MTNLGFRRAMSAAGIEVHVTDVGDRYVLERMLAEGLVLGGEPSGHLINLRHGPTGDGLASGLQLLASLVAAGGTLREAAAVVRHLPQRLVSVPAARRSELARAEPVWEAVSEFEAEMGDDGRIVVRASGTEPLVRVMVEAPTEDACERWCSRIAALVRESLDSG
jgi:phosphoglucosamine mutase